MTTKPTASTWPENSVKTEIPTKVRGQAALFPDELNLIFYANHGYCPSNDPYAVKYVKSDIVAAKEKQAIDAAIGIVTAVNKERELAIIRAALKAATSAAFKNDAMMTFVDIENIDPQEILNSLEK